MGNECHRCGSPLASPETFCPNCGAPQLLYDAGAEEVGVPGTPPPAPTRSIDWKHAIGAAVTFAVPVGLICSVIVPVPALDCLFVMGGSVAGVWLYRRRSAAHTLTRPVGLRIGIILGLMTAVVASAFNAGAMVFGRYVLHGGEAMDKLFTSSLAEGSKMTAQLFAFPPEQISQNLQYSMTPDGRAGMTLLGAILAAGGIVIFATIGGAMGVRIFSGQNPSTGNS